jgi:hypothetical protein
MPTFMLYIKADLENIAKIDVPLGHSFCIDVSTIATQVVDCAERHLHCRTLLVSLSSSSCNGNHQEQHATAAASVPLYCLPFDVQVKESAGSETRERVHVTAAETHEMSGSKGTANFVMKFAKDSRHECSINVMQLKGVTRPVTGALQPAASSCRCGLLPSFLQCCPSCATSFAEAYRQTMAARMPASSNMQDSKTASTCKAVDISS